MSLDKCLSDLPRQHPVFGILLQCLLIDFNGFLRLRNFFFSNEIAWLKLSWPLEYACKRHPASNKPEWFAFCPRSLCNRKTNKSLGYWVNFQNLLNLSKWYKMCVQENQPCYNLILWFFMQALPWWPASNFQPSNLNKPIAAGIEASILPVFEEN